MRILKVAVVLGAVGLTSVITATPASAATGSIVDNGNGTMTVTYSGFNGSVDLYLCDTSIPAGSCTPINATYVYGGAGGPGNSLGASPATISAGMSARTGNAGGYSATTIAAGTYNVKLFDTGVPSFTATLSNAVLGSGGGGGASGGSTSSSAAPPPAVFDLMWARDDGGYCTTARQSADEGSWITLPTAKECTPPANKLKATLLGWSTDRDFPIAIAKRQVANGWGTYETVNADQEITGVFIPVGGGAYLTNTNTLYPIWSE